MDKFINIDGSKIHYLETGEDTESAGDKAVLFVHGAGGSAEVWRKILDEIDVDFGKSTYGFVVGRDSHPDKGVSSHSNLRSYRFIALDLPGHGLSQGGGSDRIEDYRDFVLSFIRGLNLKEVVLAGHSMGGAISLSTALHFPSIVHGLILIGTGARLRVAPMIFEALKGDFEAAVRMGASLAFYKETPKDIVEAHIKEMLKCKPEVRVGDFRACDRFDVIDRLNEIKVPTLIICGKEDQMTPPKYSQFLNKNINDSRLVLVDTAAHMVIIEQPGEVFGAVLDFLGKI